MLADANKHKNPIQYTATAHSLTTGATRSLDHPQRSLASNSHVNGTGDSARIDEIGIEFEGLFLFLLVGKEGCGVRHVVVAAADDIIGNTVD